MSGIAGIIHFDGASAEPGRMEAMTSAMAHRGPDGVRHWIKGTVALGQCMLRATPESLEETQPLANEDESLVLVMDGRVDNWEELRRDLLAHGAILRDRSDAELALRAYEAWGRECLARIDGDFALAIWDARRREVFCARDRMGHKPFNYHWDGKTFAFASEPRPLLDLPWVKQEPNEGMLAEYLADEWHSHEETLWKGILRLVAAHRMSVGGKGPCCERYWEPNLWAPLPFREDKDYIEYYRELLFDRVRRLSRSHRPVAIEVSGGLDSSAVFCVAEHLRRAGKLPAPAIEGYTIAFSETDGEAFELDYARAVGKHWGLNIREIPPSKVPLSWFAERARARRGFPGCPNESIAVGLYERVNQQGCRVILTGLGGDQWLGQGMPRVYYSEEFAQGNWRRFHECCKADASIFGMSQVAKWLLRYGMFPLLPPSIQEMLRLSAHKFRKGKENAKDRYGWLSPRMREILKSRQRKKLCLGDRHVAFTGQRLLLEILHDAFVAQAMDDNDLFVARFGMESRHPLDDPALVQYAFSAPTRLKLRGDTARFTHIQALNGVMPQVILKRKSKAELSGVFLDYLLQMENVFNDRLPARRAAWIDPQGLEDLYRLYLDNPDICWPMWILWAIYGCDEALHFSQ